MSPMQDACDIRIRVRYAEVDRMGVVHHSRYWVYFEMGRTELLRACGGNYREMEEEGLRIVVVKADCRYRRPARYDDVLRVQTTVAQVSAARIEHEYHVRRDGELLAVGHVTLAVIDSDGHIQRVPEWMHGE